MDKTVCFEACSSESRDDLHLGARAHEIMAKEVIRYLMRVRRREGLLGKGSRRIYVIGRHSAAASSEWQLMLVTLSNGLVLTKNIFKACWDVGDRIGVLVCDSRKLLEPQTSLFAECGVFSVFCFVGGPAAHFSPASAV
jgi:hypothetical protein